ncbi:hypothetical protein NPIL_35011 [Nephila pilipes]|uniref:Uncharacterized protein n=1 Tax=Nephila pilipes TaxID=299642 RepID=A0A8X6M8N6_NEPPI|nr:hypothetical protein NPIL_35011 [Nephila pilipes]
MSQREIKKCESEKNLSLHPLQPLVLPTAGLVKVQWAIYNLATLRRGPRSYDPGVRPLYIPGTTLMTRTSLCLKPEKEMQLQISVQTSACPIRCGYLGMSHNSDGKDRLCRVCTYVSFASSSTLDKMNTC